MRWAINIIKADKYPISREAKLILLVAQWILDIRKLTEIEKILVQDTVDWQHFNVLLAEHELPSFAYACFKNHFSFFPGSEVDLLKKTHYFNLGRLAGLQKAFFGIVDFFQAQGVDFLPLKGSAFLVDNIYGDKAGLRPMVDIDILVKQENLSQAEKLLETLGYQKDFEGLKEDYWRKRNYHIVFAKKEGGKSFPTLVEAHWLLDYPGKIPLLPFLWDRVRKIQVEGREVFLLSPEDTLFSLALHLRRLGNVLSLKSACDFACLLTKYQDLDWDYILREARNGKMCASLYFRLLQANIFFDIQMPGAILNSLKLADYKKRLIESFILKNTFSASDDAGYGVFLKNHFLVYDNFREPVNMAVNIPQEQFAKFFRLSPYSLRAVVWHRLRFLYIPFYLILLILKSVSRKIAKGLIFYRR